ncbi:glycosyltransferase family 10 [Pseudomonas solani]|uniref:glycosyltransferase family 10 domain-containing protein n=1 Tax=Pseudomonas solani TaxID=2731552 RepID=UPI0035BE2B12
MKKASLVVSDFYSNNKIFDVDDAGVNRDGCLSFFYELKMSFRKRGYDLATSDIHFPMDSDVVLYNEMPAVLPEGRKCAQSFLLLYESVLVRPDNWDSDRHKRFNRIFTWNDGLVDHDRYFKFNFCHEFPSAINRSLKSEKKLCTLIAGNKKASHELELYSKRREAIDWFEKNHLCDFDFYGLGWDKFYFSGSKFFRALNRFPLLGEFFAPKLKSYKGTISTKREVLERYQFSICYENARDIPGYITEKIFDSFFAGCVPVYWGADNVEEHIPRECFIDRREFPGYAELYDYLQRMTDARYVEYLDSIESFLLSSASEPFRSGGVAEHVVETILDAQS